MDQPWQAPATAYIEINGVMLPLLDLQISPAPAPAAPVLSLASGPLPSGRLECSFSFKLQAESASSLFAEIAYQVAVADGARRSRARARRKLRRMRAQHRGRHGPLL